MFLAVTYNFIETVIFFFFFLFFLKYGKRLIEYYINFHDFTD